mmetsp:Transcript_1124/g.2908  ORF Transcript_1124/g.2908 Transcript_1124/m.2908 type:complete len:84 (-) Transcript_1124:627-878(-)
MNRNQEFVGTLSPPCICHESQGSCETLHGTVNRGNPFSSPLLPVRNDVISVVALSSARSINNWIASCIFQTAWNNASMFLPNF